MDEWFDDTKIEADDCPNYELFTRPAPTKRALPKLTVRKDLHGKNLLDYGSESAVIEFADCCVDLGAPAYDHTPGENLVWD